ncbi:MAG: oligosaccharide flippase family protein [Roseivirga sp.]|nr:oligosaccharide flippase family protein [Roseivirga sp.]
MKNQVLNIIKSKGAWSLYGQAAFLLANFTLFLVLIKSVDSALFGIWALYVTIISIADSLRQGLLQHGLTRSIIREPQSAKSLIASGLLINYGYILLMGTILWLISGLQSDSSTSLYTLLAHAVKSLIGLGTLQFINILYFSRERFKAYFISNLFYLLTFGTGLIIIGIFDTLSFIAVINLQCLAIVPSVLHYLITNQIKWVAPSRSKVQELLSFGKYIAGTNLLSMLFHKADVLMLAIYTDPVAVALFHFATKIVGYAEVPLNALSQVIYPRLAASNHEHGATRLKQVYLSSIFNLLLMAIPITALVIMFRSEIISLLSTDTYASSAPLIVILCLAGLFKPFGRVFGLTLDAIGKPKINFQMLCLSLLVNIGMNLLLIPSYGVLGAAIATCSSIVITVIWGQVRIKKHIGLDHSDLIRKMTLIKENHRLFKLNTL